MTPFGGTVENVNKTHEHSFGSSEGENLESYNDDDNEDDDDDDEDDDDVYDDEYVPDEGELKYSWYEHEDRNWNKEDIEEPVKSEKQTGRKRSLNVAYTEEDSLKPKKKRKKTKMTRRRADTKPVDDGSEKMYRQRIR